MNGLTQCSGQKSQRAFSLIEVLVAVVVLSVGMLALAALQANLTRSVADARIRTQALNHAHQCIDNFRARAQAMGTVFNTVLPTGAATLDCSNGAAAAENAATFTATGTVSRFVGNPAGTDFCRLPAASGSTCTAPSGATAPEFRVLEVVVAWTDSAGQANSLTLSDVLSPTKTRSSDDIVSKPITGSTVSGPQVRITRPTSVGVIPIAVGDGSEATAASNPRPRSFTSGRTDVTQYEVLQYRADGANAVLQQKVEVQVAGCACTLTAPASPGSGVFQVQREPVYWNGSRYVGAEVVPASASKPRGQRNTAITQDVNLCTACCANHHDYTAAKVKFDAFRPAADVTGGNHKHYALPTGDAFDPAATAVGSGGNYHEVCRMIRHDGFFQVATDAHLMYMNLLKTDVVESNALNLARPNADAVSRYQNFVRDYLIGKFDGVSAPNSTDPASTIEPVYPDILVNPARLDFNAIGTNPAIAGLTGTGSSTAAHFLHSRGLYLDYIEEEALERIKQAADSCTATTAAGRLDCILLNLPVVTVNTKDLSVWISPSNPGRVSVTAAGTPPNLNLGVVTRVANGDTNVDVQIGRSNAGLARVKPTDPCDGGVVNADFACAAQIAKDRQRFCVGNCGESGESKIFFVQVAAFPTDGVFSFSNFSLSWSMPDASVSGVCGPVNAAGRAVCLVPENVTLPQKAVITVAGYNNSDRPTAANPCSIEAPDVQTNRCLNYHVGNVLVGNTGLNALLPEGTVSVLGVSGKLSERTALNINSSSVGNNSVVTISITQDSPWESIAPLVCTDTTVGTVEPQFTCE